MATQPDPFPSLLARIRRIEKRQDQHAAASPFFGTGVHPNGQQGLDSDNYVPDMSGFSLNGGTGTPEFNDLKLRGGIIGNDALTNPVRGDSAYTAASGFGVTTTGTTPLATQSWFTPDGFTTANVLITSRVFAYNSTASLDYLYARARVYIPATGAEGYGNGLPLAVSASGGSGLNQSPVSIKVLNLAAGQEIRLQVQGWTNGANWTADAGNVADVAGQIIWTR